MRLGVDTYRRNVFLYLSTLKWIGSLEEHAVEEGNKEEFRLENSKDDARDLSQV